MIADIFTKSLGATKFEQFTKRLCGYDQSEINAYAIKVLSYIAEENLIETNNLYMYDETYFY